MQEPSYHLEAVVKSRDQMEDFTGPLDLILMLLSRNKIEIRDIQISELLDQYMDYLARMKEMDLEIASEFVQMASQLTYIKTKMLLSGDEEPDELELLVNALEQLQNRDILAAVKEIGPELERRSQAGLRLHVREPSVLPGQRFEYHSDGMELLRALGLLLLRGDAPRPEEESRLLEAIPRPIVYGIREKSRQLVRLLRERPELTMGELYGLCASRSELVATFISVLELCSDGKISVTREGSDYRVCRRDGEGEDEHGE